MTVVRSVLASLTTPTVTSAKAKYSHAADSLVDVLATRGLTL